MTARQPPSVSGARPLVGHTLEFLIDPIALLKRGHEEHGDLYMLHLGRRPAVVLLGPEHSRFFFAETDRMLSIRTAYPFFARMFDENFFFLGGAEEYQRQRALVLPRFRSNQLAGYVDAMVERVGLLQQSLGEEGEFDLVTTLGPLVMQIAAHAFLGPDVSTRLGFDFFERFRRFSGGMEAMLPLWLPLPRLLRARRARDELRTMVGELVEQRRTNPIEPADFLQVLTEARFADGDSVPDLVVINLILMLVWAGHETTTGHVSWALIDLLSHPTELLRVRQEGREALDGAPGLDLAKINRLTYLDRALHETERLHPVAHILVRSAAETFDYNGYQISRGSMIIASPAVSHRLSDLYPEPDLYQPDRFQSDPRVSRALIGFGGGVHRCLGVHFAYLEMKVIITILLRDYELELIDPDPQPVPGPRTKWPQRPCRVRYRWRVPVTPAVA